METTLDSCLIDFERWIMSKTRLNLDKKIWGGRMFGERERIFLSVSEERERNNFDLKYKIGTDFDLG